MTTHQPFDPFDDRMPDEALDAYLQVCHEIYLEMLHSGDWPWAEDSQNPDDLVESDGN